MRVHGVLLGNILFVNVLTIVYILVHGFLRNVYVYYSMKQIFEEEGKPPVHVVFKIFPRSLF